MRLSSASSLARLAAADHAVLGTVHPRRGVDLVPVVPILVDDHVGVPVDTVKPKSSTRLGREANLETDPRATLLVEHWDPLDWSTLWWVRATLLFLGGADATSTDPVLGDVAGRLADALADRHAQYHDRPFARMLVFRVDGVTGWAAAE